MEQEVPIPAAAEAPLGMYPVRIDAQGRLKLPSDFQQYFSKVGQNKFFITSLDRRIGYLYPSAVWRENLKFFAAYRDDPATARAIKFNSTDLGREVEVDSQWRLMLPEKLRGALGLENQTIQLYAVDARFEFLNEQVYQETIQISTAVGPDGVNKLQREGLK
jgi:MraZ protein